MSHVNQPAWIWDGLCITAPDPDLWFPEAGRHDVAREAMTICWSCPVQRDCLDYALALEADLPTNPGYQHGIWGGLPPAARRKLRQAG